MPLQKKIAGIGAFLIFSCDAEPIPPPENYAVPLHRASPEETNQHCAKEIVRCNYRFFHHEVSGFKCRTEDGQLRLYFTERNTYGLRLWYKDKPHKDINNYQFAEYCSSTFGNYAWFMGERSYTEK